MDWVGQFNQPGSKRNLEAQFQRAIALTIGLERDSTSTAAVVEPPGYRSFKERLNSRLREWWRAIRIADILGGPGVIFLLPKQYRAGVLTVRNDRKPIDHHLFFQILVLLQPNLR